MPEDPARPPRFPYVAALLCAACVGAAGWVWAGRHTRLVERFVSANPPTWSEWAEELPATWSEAENQRVWQAYRDAVTRGRAVVPALIANLDRQEYSTYVSTAVPYDGVTVGGMCRIAVEETFDPIGIFYKSRQNDKGETLLGETFFDGAFSTPRTARRWWELNRTRTSREIQESVRAWYVARESSFGFEDEAQRRAVLQTIDERYRQRRDVASWSVDGASVAGLVVGAMGVFVFAVALRHWLGERRKFRGDRAAA